MGRRAGTFAVGGAVLLAAVTATALTGTAATGKKKPRPTTTTRATTTTVRPTTTTAAPGVCSGMNVAPGSSVQAAVNAAPTGATLCLSGSYSGVVAPKAGQRLIGPATLAGAIVGPATDVTVQAITIDGTGQAFGIRGAPRWKLTDVGVTGANIGVGVASGMTIVRGALNSNGQYGFVGGPLSDLTIDGTEVAYNNTHHLDPNWDAGASKIHGLCNMVNGVCQTPTPSQRITFRNMRVHDNWGPGLWCDWSCGTVTYDGNEVWSNQGPGIFHEVSFDATITNNRVRDNCLGLAFAGSVWYCAEIYIAEGTNVTVATNIVGATTNGIGGKNVARDDLETPLGRAQLCNVTLAGNWIIAPGTAQGWVGSNPACPKVWTVN